VSDAGLVLKFFPDFVSRADRDQVSSIFNNTSCRAGAGAGDGHGHTVVDTLEPQWSRNREYVLDRLRTLRGRGCVVRLMITRGGVTPYVMGRLLASGLDVRYTDQFVGDVRTLYAHSKYIAISGGFYANPKTHTVFTSSANMTLTATRSSDNTMLRIRDDAAVYASYAANFDHVWSTSTPLTRSNATITAAQRRASVVE
jgi:phosphatidylserine/phosphatidylglycerophosphate/cardiolipin synthase-like enzyme